MAPTLENVRQDLPVIVNYLDEGMVLLRRLESLIMKPEADGKEDKIAEQLVFIGRGIAELGDTIAYMGNISPIGALLDALDSEALAECAKE